MAKVSNWRAWYERNYETSPGTWAKEKEELSQLYSLGYDYPNATYKQYYINEGYMFNTVADGNQFAYAFNPGLLYLAPKYYTIYDMFTTDEINNFVNEALESFVSYLHDGKTGIVMPTNIFWKGPTDEGKNNDVFWVPFLSYSIERQNNPNLFTTDCWAGLGFFATAFNPHYLTWENNGLMYNGQPLSFGDDYASVTGGFPRFDSVGGGDFSVYAHEGFSDDYSKAIDNLLKLITKVKFYPAFAPNLYDISIDGVNYGRINNRNTPTVTAGNNIVGFLYVYENSPFFPVNGFTCQSSYWAPTSYPFGGSKHGFIVEVRTNGGPDAENPDDKDDPNDDDPGPGDDEGGDGDHNDETDPVPPPGPPTISGSGVGLFTIFNPNSSQLAALGKKLWTPGALDVIKQYFTNPMEAIIGLGIVPVKPKTGSSANIHLGLYDTEIAAPLVDSDYVIKDCGSISITRYYGSYLDYDPYTKISLYLPYIGEIDIDPDQVMQTNLGVKYYINVVSGDIVAMVTANDSLIYTVAGNCMRQLPIAQRDYSSIISTAVSAVTTIASAGVSASAAKSVQGTVAGGAKSEAGRAIADARANASINNSVMGAGSSLIDQVMSTKMRYHHAGDIGTGSGQLTYQTPYLTIERPNLMLADAYKSFVGYPCNKTITLERCRGFTQIEATRLSIPGATDEEINEILQHLVEGVII